MSINSRSYTMPKAEANKMIPFNATLLRQRIEQRDDLSITKLAKSIGCNRKTLTRAMNSGRISEKYLKDIANYLNLKPQVLTAAKLRFGGFTQLAHSIFQLFELNVLFFDSATPERKREFLCSVIDSLVPILNSCFPDACYEGSYESIHEKMHIINLPDYEECEYLRNYLLKHLPADKTEYQIRCMDECELSTEYGAESSKYVDFTQDNNPLFSVFSHPELFRDVTFEETKN